jgi:hypothetical protein
MYSNLNSIQRLENKKYDNDLLKSVAFHIVNSMKRGKEIILMITQKMVSIFRGSY